MVIKKQYEPINNRLGIQYDPEFIFEEDLKKLKSDYLKAMLGGERFVTLSLPKTEHVDDWVFTMKRGELVGNIDTFDYSDDSEICSYEACENPLFEIYNNELELTKVGKEFHDENTNLLLKTHV